MGNKAGKQRERKNLGQDKTLDTRGKTFYEAMPAAVAAPKVWSVPRPRLESLISFSENIIWFLLGMAEVLLFARTLMIWAGAQGGNLFSFAVYALSYPFVFLINPEAQQVPAKTGAIIPETISIMLVYFIIAYVVFKLLRALKMAEEGEV